MKPVIRIDGVPIEPLADATALEVEPGVYSILLDGASHEVRIDGEHVAVGDRRFKYEVEDPRQWRRSGGATGGGGRAAILAPMPGKIVRILVAAGDDVEVGRGIVVVEAMKMQNEMKAPVGGRIAAINVKENDSVNAGALLAVIEPSAPEPGR